jgi:hypothetical protein
MLCAGLVHGDLSDFNVLIAWDGPVIIDFPQAVDPAHNNNAGRLFVRDVDNLVSFIARFAPEVKGLQYGKEIWDLYERSVLQPDTPVTGKFKGSDRKADTTALLREIEAVEREAMARREALGLAPPRPARAPVVYDAPPPRPIAPGAKGQQGGGRGDRRGDAPRGRDGDRRDGPPERRGDAPRGRDGDRRDGPPERRGDAPRGRDGDRRDGPPERRGDAPRGDRRDAPRGDRRDDGGRPPRGDEGPRGGWEPREPRREPRSAEPPDDLDAFLVEG